MTIFVVVTALMLAAALAYLLLPVLRGRSAGAGADVARRIRAMKAALAEGVLSQEEYDRKLALIPALGATEPSEKPALAFSTKMVIASIAMALPLSAFLLYRSLGQPETLSPAGSAPPVATAGADNPAAAGTPGMDMSAAIASLTAKLEKNPDDVDGWLLLGRAYTSEDRNNEASDALGKAYLLAPERPDIEIAYAQALALANPSRRIDGKPLQMIMHALAADPSNQDGLWLLGMSAYQNGLYAEAIASWEKIVVQLSPDSDVLESVTSMIADAKAHLPAGAGALARVGATPPVPATDTAAGPQVKVHVTIDGARFKQVAPGDTLFVYAKAASGPPMPIAIQKLHASALPVTVILTDGMGMMPSMNLSQFPKVIILARISKSGNAIAQSGDLQAVPITIDVNQRETVELRIDQVVP